MVVNHSELIRPVQRVFPLELQQHTTEKSHYNEIVIEKLKIKKERNASKNVEMYMDDSNI